MSGVFRRSFFLPPRSVTPREAQVLPWSKAAAPTDITGDIDTAAAGQVSALNGTVVVAGDIDTGAGAQFSDLSGTVVVSGDADTGAGAQFSTLSGTVVVSGDIDTGAAGQVSALSGTVVVSGDADTGSAAQTTALSGTVVVSGDADTGAAAQTTALVGDVEIVGVTGDVDTGAAGQATKAFGPIPFVPSPRVAVPERETRAAAPLPGHRSAVPSPALRECAPSPSLRVAVPPESDRTVEAEHDEMETLVWDEKDPSEILDYDLKMGRLLADGETISTVVWVVPGGIVKDTTNDPDGQSHTAEIAKIWLSGGTDGVDYAIQATVTTSVGRVFQRTITIPVRQK